MTRASSSIERPFRAERIRSSALIGSSMFLIVKAAIIRAFEGDVVDGKDINDGHRVNGLFLADLRELADNIRTGIPIQNLYKPRDPPPWLATRTDLDDIPARPFVIGACARRL